MKLPVVRRIILVMLLLLFLAIVCWAQYGTSTYGTSVYGGGAPPAPPSDLIIKKYRYFYYR